MLKLGNKSINKLYLGEKPIIKAYLGEKLIYSKAPIFLGYIESNGKQYIDTEYIMTSDIQECEIEFQYTDPSGTQSIFGSLPSSNRSIHSYSDSTGVFRIYAGQPLTVTFSDFNFEEKHTLYAKAELSGKLRVTLDGSSKSASGTLSTLNTVNYWYLFGRNPGNNGGAQALFIGKIFKFKMYDNGVLVRDFKPCLDDKGVACMYDMVTGKYFYNKGSGNFLYEE